MKNFLSSTLDSVLDMSAETIIAGVVVALLLTLPIAGAYAAFRRGGKDLAMILMGLAIVANLLGMVVASGYARSTSTTRFYRESSRGGMPRGGGPPPGYVYSPEDVRREVPLSKQLASGIFEAADLDRDGSLTADEAAFAASSFIKSAPGTGRDSTDVATLRESLRLWLRHRVGPGHPAEGPRREDAPADVPRASTAAP